jgi:hypothetical protein
MLAVPILMTVKVLCGHIEGWGGFGEFLSGPAHETDQAEIVTSSPLIPVDCAA